MRARHAVLALIVAGCLPTAQQRRAPRAARTAAPAEASGPASFPKAPPPPFRALPGKTGNANLDRFATLWNDIHDTRNGYFSPEGVPYHAIETLIVEAPDHGHETTSEAYSYWIWLEAAYGRLTRDWTWFDHSWKSAEAYIIPTPNDQPTAGSYNDTRPAVFAPELDLPSAYPSPMDPGVPVGPDPIARELGEAYGTPFIYGMHWILDVDNWYGFGRRGDGVSRPSYMNTFQRGMQESVWETVPHPSWETFRWGGKNGFLDLFVKQDGGYARQWKYTNAPDADARAVQAAYWAKVWADESGGSPQVDAVVKKASKMGDYLRYAFFDKYFKPLGCQSPGCKPGADPYEAAHYLISWYYAWGGSTSVSGGWSWRISSSSCHSGYQNPFAAYVMSEVAPFRPASKNGLRDWKQSLSRQLELYRWLQSAEGGIAGGTPNSWRGRYEPHPAGTTTFYKMAYDEAPVYADPPSNEWFGFQVWSMDRVAQLYFASGDERAKTVLDRWVGWVKANTRLTKDGGYEIPSTLAWSGQPSASWDASTQNWNPKDAAWNRTLRVKVKSHSPDAGVAAGLARTLAYYAARAKDGAAAQLAQELLDRLWAKYKTPKGLSSPETRVDFKRFGDAVYVPPGWRGAMPNGDVIDGNATFTSIRSRYKQDPDWPKVQAYLAGGPPPTFQYHRFWAQADAALAYATMGWLFPNGVPRAAKGAISREGRR